MRPQSIESQLGELRQSVENWRRSHRPPVAMPEELWSAAALLAAKIGVGAVAKALKLDHGKLMKLANQLGSSDKLTRPSQQREVPPTLATFVEVPAATVAKSIGAQLSCKLEVKSPGRGRLRTQLDNATALDVATILREFAR